MNLKVEPGRYIVAVSGGVDSMVLLHLLITNYQRPITNYQLIVAHYDHGIREESSRDRKFVKETCKNFGIKFVSEQGNLGPGASEALARDKRYEFLEKVRVGEAAEAVITAHHQDDLIETMIINLLRGTHRRGLTSLKSSENLIRPMLSFSKQEIKNYALANGIEWVEDESNTDEQYFRNYVRHQIIPKLSEENRQRLLDIYRTVQTKNQQIDQEITELLSSYDGKLRRAWYLQFPFVIQCEIIAEIIRNENIEISKDIVINIAIAAKVMMPGKQLDIGGGLILKSQAGEFSFVRNIT